MSEWRHLTDLEPSCVLNPETMEIGSASEMIEKLKEKFGEENIRVDNEVYDRAGNLLPDLVGVYIRDAPKKPEHLCIKCEAEEHTELGNANAFCKCGLRTCGCYAFQVHMGTREDKRKTGP